HAVLSEGVQRTTANDGLRGGGVTTFSRESSIDLSIGLDGSWDEHAAAAAAKIGRNCRRSIRLFGLFFMMASLTPRRELRSHHDSWLIIFAAHGVRWSRGSATTPRRCLARFVLARASPHRRLCGARRARAGARRRADRAHERVALRLRARRGYPG